MKKLATILFALALIGGLAFAGGGRDGGQQGAANYPGGKQITVICPMSAGGASDTVTRLVAAELEQALDTSVIVSNVTGASGAIGMERVRNARPDGYTIGYLPVESTMLKALGFTDLSSDDFRFVARANGNPAAVTVRADAPWDTFDDFIEYAKAHPGEVRVGNSGTGAIWHIAAASVERECDVQFTHVPFDGAAPAVIALLGNNIEAVTVSPSEVMNNVAAGDLKVLCVMGEDRSSVVPDVPTARELGYDLAIQAWGGFGVPKDTPQAVIDILEKAFETAVNADTLKRVLADRGYEHAYLNASDMDAYAAQQLAYFSKLIAELGIAN